MEEQGLARVCDQAPNGAADSIAGDVLGSFPTDFFSKLDGTGMEEVKAKMREMVIAIQQWVEQRAPAPTPGPSPASAAPDADAHPAGDGAGAKGDEELHIEILPKADAAMEQDDDAEFQHIVRRHLGDAATGEAVQALREDLEASKRRKKCS